MRRILLFFLATFYSLTGLSAHATTIQYQATDLPDTVPGDDLWEYVYLVEDFTFNQDYGFSVFFDHTAYAGIESPPPTVNADWDVIALQPDTGLPDDGLYDAMALTDGASLADAFVVRFVWLGSGSPRSQPFEVYGPGFDVIETGATVPEPSTALLVAGGVLLLVSRLRESASLRRR